MAYLYSHTRLDNNEIFYIGIGSGIDYKRAYSINGRNKWWKNITNKHDYKVDILLDNLTWEDACEAEKRYILKYGRKCDDGLLVNITKGGEGFRGSHTEKSKQQISKSLSNKSYEEIHGLKNADIEREKRKSGALLQWKNMTNEDKIGISNKISNGLKDYYKNNPEKKYSLITLTCPKCGKIGIGNAMYRHHFDNCGKKQIISEDQRLKMSESHKGKYRGKII